MGWNEKRKQFLGHRCGRHRSINFIEQKNRSATYIDMHEIHVETVKNTHVYQIQNTLYCLYATVCVSVLTGKLYYTLVIRGTVSDCHLVVSMAS